MRKGIYLLLIAFVLIATDASSQGKGLGLPTKKWFVGFGNLSKFTGARFNFKDKNVEKINGLNVTIWTTKNDSDQTGVVNGVSLGLPLAMGHDKQNGISVGLGVAATEDLNGINVGILGTGSGHNATGINVGGLGIGTGGNLRGINVGGLGAGAGGNVSGINVGGLGIGAGGNLSGFNFGGLGIGSGANVSGINLAGAGLGAGESVNGFSFAVVGIGAGKKVTGITIAGVGLGAGEELRGIAIAGVGLGSPKITGIAAALAVGGVDVRGVMIAPAYFRIEGMNDDNMDGVSSDNEGKLTGLSISAVNDIRGEQRGVVMGIVNVTRKIKGFQLGVINIVKENPRGLRVLPIFNTRFKKG